MLDWEKRVRELQETYGCAPRLKAEHVAEIAGHLEEVYLSYLQRGVSPAIAEKRTLNEIRDWGRFCREVFEAQEEETMSETIRKIWLPSLAMLILGLGGVSGAWLSGMFPHGFPLDSEEALLLYAPWILGSFALGVLGTVWVRRMGAGKGATAALFLLPACALILLFFARPPVTWSLVPLYPERLLPYLASCFVGWVLIPVVAALAGIMTACRVSRKPVG